MPERVAPDAIASSSGWTAGTDVVGNITDDPDSPDLNWVIAASNNTNGDLRVSFPTPSGSSQVPGQEFRVLVRKTATSGTGTPTARIELWKAGVSVSVGPNTNVTSLTGEVISYTWSGIGHAPADIECRMFCTATGGSPAVRAAVDIGAVEWNAELALPPRPVSATRAAVVRAAYY